MRICIHCGKQKEDQSFQKVKSGNRGNVCHSCKWKQKKKRSPEDNRRRHLKQAYNLSLEEYESIHELQDGRCAICKTDQKLYVDHCHDSGAIRGLLCNKCNSALGFLNDDPYLLLNGYNYLVEGQR